MSDHRCKRVFCLDRPDLQPFPSVGEAARFAGVHINTMSRGLSRRRRVRGLRYGYSRHSREFGSTEKPVSCTYLDKDGNVLADQWFPSIKAAVEHSKASDGVGLSRRQIEHPIKKQQQIEQGTKKPRKTPETVWRHAEPLPLLERVAA